MGYCHCEELPALFWSTGKRFHVVEGREGQDDQRQGIPGEIQKQRNQRPSILHEMRRPRFASSIATLGLIDVRYRHSAVMFTFKPKVHLNYEESILPMRDGLPKLKHFPAEMDGSGESHSRIEDEVGPLVVARSDRPSRLGVD